MHSAIFESTGFSIGSFKLLRRAATGIYYITWYDERRVRTRRRSTDTQVLDEAKNRLIAFAGERDHARRQCLPPEKVCIYTALDYYFDRELTHERRSHAYAQYILPRWLRFLEDNDVETIADLTVEMQRRYIDLRRSNQIQDSTIQRELAIVKAAINTYRKAGFIQYTPYILTLPKGQPRQRWLTPPEVERLLASTEQDHVRDYILIALNTLARPEAILKLTFSQVDLVNRRINFLKPGEKQSNKRKPIVSISDPLLPVLERRLAISVTGHVIEYDGKPLKAMKKAFKTAARRAGLGEEVIPYTLRHTGATWLAQSGVPLRIIAGMMGHTEQQTTELYAKHHPSFQTEAMASLKGVFGSMRLYAEDEVIQGK